MCVGRVCACVCMCVYVQVDVEDVFAREGAAPYERLAQLLAQHNDAPASNGAAEGAEDAAALRNALAGVAWTRSMRRMYTLVDR